MSEILHIPSSHLAWQESPTALFVGIDGARGGWVMAANRGGSISLTLLRTLSDLGLPNTTRALIDMPIGLPSRGKRACDGLARDLLGSRRSTIFPVPARSAIESPTYAECCEENTSRQGCRVSKQAWNLAPKIRELDLYLRDDRGRHEHIGEGHPELAFKALAPTLWPLPPKRTPEGGAIREELLSKVFGRPPGDLVRDFVLRHRGALDSTDVLDALSLCALLTVTKGQVRFVGDGACDDFGAPMRMCVG